jgi:hypothetical protein
LKSWKAKNDFVGLWRWLMVERSGRRALSAFLKPNKRWQRPFGRNIAGSISYPSRRNEPSICWIGPILIELRLQRLNQAGELAALVDQARDGAICSHATACCQ